MGEFGGKFGGGFGVGVRYMDSEVRFLPTGGDVGFPTFFGGVSSDTYPVVGV